MVPADNGIEVVVMRRLADGEAARAAIAVLSADERERAQRFILPRHRLQFVERRAALRRLLGERLGVAAARVRLSTAIDGKPSLAAPLDRSGVTFNQSHCGDLSVYAFASRTDVGIDVEAIRVIEDADHVASIAFSKREYETYERLPPSDKPIGFLNCWTRRKRSSRPSDPGFLIHSTVSTFRSCRTNHLAFCDSAALTEVLAGSCIAFSRYPASSPRLPHGPRHDRT
jgi:phosphopantetheinyl transferase